MCVIMLIQEDNIRPSIDMIERAWNKNPHGAGFAWREADEVIWEKGINDYDTAEKMMLELPTPFVAHFRIATQGGIIDEMTHPFEVSPTTGLQLKGRTSNYVLFHNGNWVNWEDTARYAAIQSGTKIPRGKWNDSRAIAWLSSIYGLGYMEWLPKQRGVAFGPKGTEIEIYTGEGWEEVNGVWCSNKRFVNEGKPRAQWGTTSKMCSFNTCTVNINLDADDRCAMHPKQNTTNHRQGTQGVSQTNLAPFPQGQKDSPVVGLQLAERLHKEGRIGKNRIKKIRKQYELAADPKLRARASVQLAKLTAQLIQEGVLRLSR